jgi:hypothetical protein
VWRAGQSIRDPTDREIWLTLGRAHGSLLERLSFHNDPWAALTILEQWPSFHQLDIFLGAFLSSGVKASCMRISEELNGETCTAAVRIYLPSVEHADFGLEIWLSEVQGNYIAHQVESMTSIEDWKNILGTYLYGAMMESRMRKSEVALGITRTGAARISPLSNEHGNQDWNLKVLMSYPKGTEVWISAY